MDKPTIRSLLTKDLILFLVGLTFAEATRAMTTVQIPVFLREIGASVGEVGLFFTISMILPIVLRVWGGWFSDVTGRLRTIWLGSLAGVLAYIPYALAHRWEIALLGPALLAIATALIYPSYQSYIADTIPESARGRVYGMGRTFLNVAWILAPPAGGYLAEHFGTRSMFLTAFLLYLIASIIFFFLHRRSAAPDSGASPRKANWSSLSKSFREIMPIAFAGGLLTWILVAEGIKEFSLRLSFDLMPVYLSDIAGISKQGIGWMDGLHGIAWVLASPIGGWFSDRTSERHGFTFGLILTLSMPLIFALSAGFWGFALSWILLGIGGAFLDPAYNALVARGTPSHLRGIAYALIATLVGIIALPSPWIGSRMWEALGPQTPFFFSFGLGSLALLPAWFRLRIKQTESGPLPAAAGTGEDPLRTE